MGQRPSASHCGTAAKRDSGQAGQRPSGTAAPRFAAWEVSCRRWSESPPALATVEEVRAERSNDVIIVLVGNKTDLVDKRRARHEGGGAP